MHRNAIITGGTSGIGLAAARALLRESNAVVLWARDARRGEEAVRQLQRDVPGSQVAFHACDVADADVVQQAVHDFSATHDTLHILINAAGILRRTPLSQSQADEITRQI